MTNTQTRVLTAVVVVPVLLVMIYLGGMPLTIFIAVFMLLGLIEYFNMAKLKGFEPHSIIGILVPVAGIIALGAHKPIWGLTIFGCGALLVLTAELARKPEGSIGNVASTLFGMFYVGLLVHAVLIREYLGNDRIGILFILLALAGSILCDAGAYFIGRAYGVKKLIPHISPGKTVAGSAGGLVTGVLAVYLFKGVADTFMDTRIGWLEATILGVLIAITGMIGDLVESMIKRDAGVKDSGNIFPGHGGMLDRIDSPLFTITITFYFVLMIGAFGK